MNPDTLRVDTRIGSVDLKRRVMGGFALVFDSPGPGVSWDADTNFTWRQAGVAVHLCHAGFVSVDERVWLGAAKLSRDEHGIIAVVWLEKLMPPYAPTLADIAREPGAWAFSVELDAMVIAEGTAHVVSANIRTVGLSRWTCAASTWYARNPDQVQPVAEVTPREALATFSCCLQRQPGCWFKPGTPPIWAGK